MSLRPLLALLLTTLILPPEGLAAGLGADDGERVPAAIEALLGQPDPPFFFGIPPALDAEPRWSHKAQGQARVACALDDANGNGAAELAVGLGPGAQGPSLVVRDGRSGATLWSASPDGGAFRSLRGLVAGAGHLALGVTSPRGRVELRTAAGELVWGRDLAGQAGRLPANVLAVELVPPAPGEGGVAPDVLVGGGHRIDAVVRLAGADGAERWRQPTGDSVYDLRLSHDGDGDGARDVVVVGGNTAPFASLLSSATGEVLWTATLPGTGSVVRPMDDVDGDRIPDLAVGLFHEPGSCLLALSGADGATLWSAVSVTRDVTSLDLADGILDPERREIVVGSFDNAVSVVSSRVGFTLWRREGSENLGGSMLSVAVVDDLDHTGARDVLAASVDHRAWLMGGTNGQYMARHDLGAKASVVAAVPDVDGDGRTELAVAGQRHLALLDGEAGLAGGPRIMARDLGQEVLLTVWAYPGTSLTVFLSGGTGRLQVPGWQGSFGLDPASLVTALETVAPGAGVSGFILGPFQPRLAGLTVYVQAASGYAPGQGLLSNVIAFEVPR